MNLKKIVIILFGLLVIGCIGWYGRDYVTLENFKLHRASLMVLVQERFFISVILFSFICFIASFSMLPVSLLFALIAGFLFGPIEGALITDVAVTAGATVMLIILRNFCSPWVERRYGHKLHKFNEELEKNGASYLLMINLLTIVPFFIVSLLVSLTKLSWITFAWTLFVGFLPAALIFAFAGRQLGSVNSVGDILSAKMMFALALLALLAAVPIIVKRFKLHRAQDTV
jgi:uncharacterized membrane protein YdjX (TVP38/TMEM64 family)